MVNAVLLTASLWSAGTKRCYVNWRQTIALNEPHMANWAIVKGPHLPGTNEQTDKPIEKFCRLSGDWTFDSLSFYFCTEGRKNWTGILQVWGKERNEWKTVNMENALKISLGHSVALMRCGSQAIVCTSVDDDWETDRHEAPLKLQFSKVCCLLLARSIKKSTAPLSSFFFLFKCTRTSPLVGLSGQFDHPTVN